MKWYQRTSEHVGMFADQLVYCVRNAKYNFVDHEGCEGVVLCAFEFCFWRLKTKSRQIRQASWPKLNRVIEAQRKAA
jgi:hypothetical protein